MADIDLSPDALTRIERGATYCLVLAHADAEDIVRVKAEFEHMTGASLFVVVTGG